MLQENVLFEPHVKYNPAVQLSLKIQFSISPQSVLKFCYPIQKNQKPLYNKPSNVHCNLILYDFC